ncbi:ATPase associated with various cellular activities (AAA) family protein [Candida albicans]|uniref:ATPase associated with various cellular activities (AAA) family protein n=1 Tax=Candida albicans TaxID=5476 RepID=A0A8H6BS65_CANAX|nr:ATPase associated with various cellular activities (AAA) family protein [Candida albicans]
MSKSRTVTGSLDQKIYNLIHDLLQEQTEENKRAATADEEHDPFSCMASSHNLTVSQVLAYVQMKDFQLKRMKKNYLEKSIAASLKVIRQDETEEFGDRENGIGDESEAENDRECENDLMEVKDSNAINKSVVSLWNQEKTDGESDGKQKKGKSSAKTQLKKQKRKIDYSTPNIDLSSLGGVESVTTQLLEIIGLPILHPEIYSSTGVEPPRGVLLYGPPGCGKTTIANALAGELKVPFINISAPSVVSGMSGESEKKLREIFEEAKQIAPCLIFMDEIDAITPKRDGGAQREMEKRIVAQLLTLMDELTLEKTGGKPVVVIGATNRPDSLDSALRRAGRFDREICLNVPNEEQRISILKAMTKNIKLENGEHFNYRELSKLTPGYVGADLKSLVTAAGISAIKRIFETMSELQEESHSVKDDSMDVDPISLDTNKEDMIKKFEQKSEAEKLSTIKKFLNMHPDPLNQEQLAPLAITYQDFVNALPSVQPSAKREGFATIPDVTWQNVGALFKIRMELHMCIVQPIKKPELYLKVGIAAPAGVLMWGPPGCGKTLLAKAVANESRANFISIKGPELLNKYVGESEKAVRQVFQRARASTPCIIFFDELDALVPRRDTSMSESSSRVVNTLLTELDGLNDRKGVFVIGATNRPDMIDPAMLSRRPRCGNFSGADLSSLVKEAGVWALKKRFFQNQKIQELDSSGFYEDSIGEDDISITAEDFDHALSSIRPSVSDRDRMRYEKLNKKLGWNIISDKEPDDAGSTSDKND